MRFTVVTIFPEMFDSVLAAGVLGRAIEAGLVEVDFVDPRDFTSDRHRTVDDAPYGGGPGMVMKVEPLVAAIEAACERTDADSVRLLMSPAGDRLDQRAVRQLADRQHLVLVCGRYEGIDQRVVDLAIDRELSVGDFVLSGGEIAAAAVIDAVSRYVPGVLGEATSTDEESFSADLLEYPHYTRPAEFRGLAVPPILASGDHGKIAAWRRAQAFERTAARRPDLLAGGARADEITALAGRTYVALVHHPVVDRTGAVVTSSVTNLDIHDIARSCATYGLAGYFAVSPVASQREKIERIVGVWPEQGGRSGNPEAAPDHRIEALRLIRTAADLAEVGRRIERDHKRPPRVVATSARPAEPARAVSPPALVASAMADSREPLLVLFGTGWGLASEVISSSDQVLTPVLGRSEFNHLSVRSAVAAVLDRLFGLRP
jgi:tRNA (guanine37-N1)-methyltransferase